MDPLSRTSQQFHSRQANFARFQYRTSSSRTSHLLSIWSQDWNLSDQNLFFFKWAKLFLNEFKRSKLSFFMRSKLFQKSSWDLNYVKVFFRLLISWKKVCEIKFWSHEKREFWSFELFWKTFDLKNSTYSFNLLFQSLNFCSLDP